MPLVGFEPTTRNTESDPKGEEMSFELELIGVSTSTLLNGMISKTTGNIMSFL